MEIRKNKNGTRIISAFGKLKYHFKDCEIIVSTLYDPIYSNPFCNPYFLIRALGSYDVNYIATTFKDHGYCIQPINDRIGIYID